MLSLDDAKWKDLEHAYGNAADIPDLLRSLAISSRQNIKSSEDLWSNLWSCLCHQGDVYTASYAAVPHIVKIASESQAPINPSFFQLPVDIELARKSGRGPEIPEPYTYDYHDALSRLMYNIILQKDVPWDRSMLLSVAAAQAIAKGHHDIAEAILNLDDDLISKINNHEID